MSVEYYPARKITWSDLVMNPPMGLRWDGEEQASSQGVRHRRLTDDRCWLECYSGRAGYEDLDATTYETFGSSSGLDHVVPILKVMSAHFGTPFYEENCHFVVTGDQVLGLDRNDRLGLKMFSNLLSIVMLQARAWQVR